MNEKEYLHDGDIIPEDRYLFHREPLAYERFLGWVNYEDGFKLNPYHEPVYEDIHFQQFFVNNDLKEYVFEAEYCPCITSDNVDGMEGSTYSGGVRGKGLIAHDSENITGASNGYFVHFLYKEGCHLLFDIESSSAVEYAYLLVRFSSEYYYDIDETTEEGSYLVNSDCFAIKVNGQAQEYNPFIFDHIANPDAMNWQLFQTYLLPHAFSLREGTNTIDLVTLDNNSLLGGYLDAAPMVDCITILSSSSLSWPSENISNIEDLY